MAYDFEKNIRSKVDSSEIDLGLKAYMNKVYSFMAFGLALTGALAHLTASMAFDFSTNTMTSFGAAIYASPLAFIIMLSPLAFIIALNVGVAKNERKYRSNSLLGFCLSNGSFFFILNFHSIYR